MVIKTVLKNYWQALLALMVLLVLGGGFYFSSKPVDTIKRGLPTLTGTSLIPALHVRMATDDALRSRITSFCARGEEEIFFNLKSTDEEMVGILLQWAGVDTSKPVTTNTPEGLHPHVDAFLRKAFDLSPETPVKNNPLLGKDPWLRLFQHYKVRLIAQCAGANVFDSPVSYDVEQDALSVPSGLSGAFMDWFAARLAQENDKKPYVNNLLVYINDVKSFAGLSEVDKKRLENLRK